MRKRIVRPISVLVLIAGLLYADGSLFAFLSLAESYMHEQNIVDRAWKVSRDGNVVDKFTALRNVADKIRVQEAHAAITYQSASAVANSAIIPILPVHNASISQGDLLILIIGQKPSTANSGSVGAAPEGWTAIPGGSLTGAGGYSTTLGADTGNTNVFSYYKIAEGNESSATQPVRLVTNSAAWAQMYRFTNATEDWSVAATTGSDTSGNTSMSIAMSSDPGVASGDHILAAMVIPTDVSTPTQFSAEALSQSGITFGTVTEISEPDTTSGNDLGGVVVRSSVSSGTSSGNPTFSGTAGGTTTNVRGPGIFIRIRATGTITYQSANTLVYAASTATTAVCAAHPASVAADDLLVTILGQKSTTLNSGSVTTPPGWTAVTNGSLIAGGGYGTTPAVDTGDTNVFSFYRVALGTEASERCFLLTLNSVTWAQMYRFSSDSDVWDLAATTGSDTSGDTSVSVAMSADPGVTAGDHILGAFVIPTDVTTPNQFSSESFTQTGVTFGTVTEVNEPDSATGNDIGGVTVRSSASSGTSSAAPTMIATAAGTVTNVRGPGLFVRIRETPPTFTQSAYRFFSNDNSTDVGAALASQDTSATLASTGDAFRLRMLLHVGTANLAASAQNFKLQFAQKSGTCDTAFSGESYTDVTGATALAYNNNATPADGDNLTANANDPTHSGHTIVNQDYEEANNFTNTAAAVASGADAKWDFSLIDNGAPGGTSYCFRVVKSDDSLLDTYSVVPEIATASGGGSLTFVVSHSNFPSLSPGTPVFATTTLSVDTSNSSGWYVTLSGDDQSPTDTVMDLSTDAAVGITDQTEWVPGAATTTAGNAVRISSLDSASKVLAFRVMTASGSAPFRASSWWGTTDSYADSATTLWAGIASSTVARQIGNSSASSGGTPALSSVLYYLDTPTSQPTGTYSGGITYTATVNP